MPKPPSVDAFMTELDHPFRAEVQAVREVILGVHPGITEQVKWNAPSFSYRGYLATFSLHRREYAMLIFHDGAILNDQGGLLEGAYPDRRMVYFHSLEDVVAKRPRLEAAIREWIDIRDRKAESLAASPRD
jgi:hypothetical protein